MPDFAQPVQLNFVFATIGVIFALVALGIYVVQKFKKETL